MLLILSLSACSVGTGNNTDGIDDILRRLKPNPDEVKAYSDVMKDEYPDRYPQIGELRQIDTDYYSVSLPSGWLIDNSAFPKITNEEGETVGEIFTQSVDEYAAILPNHTELLLSAGRIKEDGLSAVSLTYVSSYPAASGIERIDIKQSIVFIDNQTGCYLSLYKAYLDRNALHYIMQSEDVIRIAKTFTILK